MTGAVESIGTDVRAMVMEGCGHYIPEEAPQRLLDALAPLLSEV
jgi:hypothetical protein